MCSFTSGDITSKNPIYLCAGGRYVCAMTLVCSEENLPELALCLLNVDLGHELWLSVLAASAFTPEPSC